MVEGEVALTQLAEVMSSARFVSNGTDATVALDTVPPGDEIVVGPPTPGEDIPPHRTLASQADSSAIPEVPTTLPVTEWQNTDTD